MPLGPATGLAPPLASISGRDRLTAGVAALAVTVVRPMHATTVEPMTATSRRIFILNALSCGRFAPRGTGSRTIAPAPEMHRREE